MSDNNSSSGTRFTFTRFTMVEGDDDNEQSSEDSSPRKGFAGSTQESQMERHHLEGSLEPEETHREYLTNNGRLEWIRSKMDTRVCWIRRLLYESPDEAATLLDQIIASSSATTLLDPEDDEEKVQLVDFVPHLADNLANDVVAWPRLKPLVNSHLLRIVESALLCSSYQVVKAGHGALMRLLEHGLLQSDVLEQRVWPILLEKIGQMPDTEVTLSTIHLMNKMTAWLGDDQTERVVVPALDQMSSDPNFTVRRVCAQLYGDFCAVVSITCAEKLVPAFLRLCKDDEWVVRKTCAEVFMSVSSTVSLETRKDELAPAFDKLLKDQVRWVYLAAYQSLGPFITTFADPSITILGYNHLGELVLKHPDGFESRGQTDGRGDNEDIDGIMEDGSERFRNSSWRSQEDKGSSERRLYMQELIGMDKDDLVLDSNGEEVKNGVELLFDGSRGDEEEAMDEVGEAILELGTAEEEVIEEEIEDEEEEAQEATENSGREVNDNEGRQSVDDYEEDIVIDHIEEVVASGGLSKADGKDENFNTFQFWREPLPNIDIELENNANVTSKDMKHKSDWSPNSPKRANSNFSETHLNNNSLENVSLRPSSMQGPPHTAASKQNVNPALTDFKNLKQFLQSNSDRKNRRHRQARKVTLDTKYARDVLAPDRIIPAPERIVPADLNAQTDPDVSEGLRGAINAVPQDIVPHELIKHFVSMSKLAMDKEYGNDLAHHCAYNLPAVVLTLGPQHWELLKPAYKALAEDMHWKVRRTAASSIHELAVIVGEEVATEDLVPVFHGFIKDLDEVRVAALKHLAHFLKLLQPAGRNTFLPLLTEFLMMDNQWRWRFRQELAEQLLQVLGLFSPADTCQHLSPVVMSLLLDRVSDVRKIALQLATELVSHVSIDVSLLRSLLAELAEQFAHSSRWNRRQTFALFCSRLVSESVLSGEMFARDVLPHLLDLSWDRVPNVRLTVARALASDLMAQPYFTDVNSPHHELLVGVLKRLQTDKDKDVRYFASQVPPNLQTHINESNQKQMLSSSSSNDDETIKNI